MTLRVEPPTSVAYQDRNPTARKPSHTDYCGREIWARTSVVAPHDVAFVVEQVTPEGLAWLHRLIVRVILTGGFTTIGIVVVAVWTSRQLGEPLRVLARFAHQVRAGATDERIGALHSAEADEVRTAFNQLLDELAAQ